MIRHMKLSRMLVSTLAIFAASSCLAAASTLSKAVRTSESMEPALSFPAEEQAAQRKLDALRARTGKRPKYRLASHRRHGIGRPRRLWRRRYNRARPRRTWIGSPSEGLKLTSIYIAADVHADTIRYPDWTPASAHRAYATDPRRRQADQEPMGRRDLAAEAARRGGYKTVLSGKWHVGEAEGMRPHEVGFDEFYGYYEAEKEITQSVDKRRYPDLVLNPERLEMLRGPASSDRARSWLQGRRRRQRSRRSTASRRWPRATAC